MRSSRVFVLGTCQARLDPCTRHTQACVDAPIGDGVAQRVAGLEAAAVEQNSRRDWTATHLALTTLRRLVPDARLDQSIAALDAGDENLFVELITSGGVWNHMGSLLDRAFDDPEQQSAFVQAQLALADSLVQQGVATSDVTHYAMLLRGDEPPGWTQL